MKEIKQDSWRNTGSWHTSHDLDETVVNDILDEYIQSSVAFEEEKIKAFIQSKIHAHQYESHMKCIEEKIKAVGVFLNQKM